MEGKIIIKAKEKMACLKPNDIFSLFFVTFERLTPTFRQCLCDHTKYNTDSTNNQPGSYLLYLNL
jgi:hypothetical protein